MVSSPVPSDRDSIVDGVFNMFVQRRREPDAQSHALWEKAWAALDFSWSGLADAGWDRPVNQLNEAQRCKRWYAPAHFPGTGRLHSEGRRAWREASLQDYWRWSLGVSGYEDQPNVLLTDHELMEAGLLVQDSGALWHVIHRADIDARSTSLARAINARLHIAERPETNGAAWVRDCPDLRCQLAGARASGLDDCWRTFATGGGSKLHVRAPFAGFRKLNGDSLTFGPHTDFRGLRCQAVTFADATFGDYLDVGISFISACDFSRAQIGRGLNASSAELRGASFASGTIDRGARFDFTHFGPGADFSVAHFLGAVKFQDATFESSATFRYAEFEGYANFMDVQFEDNASFRSAKFGEFCTFSGASFGQGCDFYGAKFDDWVELEADTFDANCYMQIITANPEIPSMNGPRRRPDVE